MDLKEMYKAMVNSPVTYLSGAISATIKTIPLVDASVLPDAPNIATIGYGEAAETIYYPEKDANTLKNVTRGFQGAKKAWPASETPVARLYTAYDLDSTIENIVALLTNIQNHLESGLPHVMEGSSVKYGFKLNDDGTISFIYEDEEVQP